VDVKTVVCIAQMDSKLAFWKPSEGSYVAKTREY